MFFSDGNQMCIRDSSGEISNVESQFCLSAQGAGTTASPGFTETLNT